ncbi:N-terminal phage integrase SAM-like domain-containing protein [Ferrimicrobium sp.]|uniref:N-terminal phage integrase SAM-like domain-containing protein n=1 Tax=Ferrimicrobium sp. TaxID=2926050 RepID=UPI00262639BF|nr:N-terminal phage integrase SAM-like domain-containing protein [Ferrimicrobium sp.]
MGKDSVTEIKPGTYRIRVDAGPDPVTGKRRQASRVVHGGKRDADRALRNLTNEIEAGVAVTSHQTVKDLTDEWLEFKARTLSPKSVEYYADSLRLHILPAIGKRKVSTLTARDLHQFYLALPRSQGRRRFSGSYKARILAEYDSLPKLERGALLRREALHSSLIVEWRKQRDKGAQAGLSRQSGRKQRDPKDLERQQLR